MTPFVADPAAMIDAEGCIFIHKRKIGQSNGQGYDRKSDSYGSGLEVSNTSREIVERVLALVGKGSISTSTRGRNQPLYRWNLRSNECRDVLREVYPHLVAKQHQARLAIGCPSSGVDAEKAHASLIALHNGAPSMIDFAAPETMFEPGWYLRSDVVWSKSNPMPESVTDRPTKSHEYVFLLTKQPRYFFDQEAVREAYEGDPEYRAGRVGAYQNRAIYGVGDGTTPTSLRGPDGRRKTTVKGTDGSIQHRDGERWPNDGRNIRSVWEIATQPYAEAHFATFPEALPERCIKAGCPEGGTVIDPFMGSGTTALVARRLGRKSVGVELNPEYAALCARRLQQLSLLAEEPAA